MIDYYDKNADEFINSTFNCDMSEQYNFFEGYLDNPKIILDLGFGSGRDSLYFMSKGINVYALDPNKAFCNNAKKIGIKNIYNIKAQEMEFENLFDGIWACASLLHISSEKLNFVFKKCSIALKNKGVMYASFKYGDFEGERNGRYFLDLNEESIKKYLDDTNLIIKEYYITKDVRANNETKWLNLILVKQIN